MGVLLLLAFFSGFRMKGFFLFFDRLLKKIKSIKIKLKLSKKEEDVIANNMWLLGISWPREAQCIASLARFCFDLLSPHDSSQKCL